MVRKRRLIRHCSNRTVQRFNGSVEHNVLPQPLPQAAQDILGILGSGGVAGNAVAVAGVVKSDVSYWAKRFVASGALTVDVAQYSKTLGLPKRDQRFGPGLPKYYKLTPYGSKLLAGSEGVERRLPVVFEDMPVKFRVFRWEEFGSIDWEKLGQPRNWNQMGFRVSGVRVVKTSKNVIVHPGPLMGFDVDQLEVDSGRIVERVRYILEVKFGMQLSDDVEFCHGPMWQVFRPEAREWIKEGGVVKTLGVGALDESPKPWMKKLSGVAHVEFERKEHAALASVWPPVATDPGKRLASAASAYPLYLEEIHRAVVSLVGQVDALAVEVGSVKKFEDEVSCVMGEFKTLSSALSKLENLDKIHDCLQKITGVLSQLVDLEAGGKNGVAEPAGVKGSGPVGSGNGGKDYVA